MNPRRSRHTIRPTDSPGFSLPVGLTVGYTARYVRIVCPRWLSGASFPPGRDVAQECATVG